MNEKEWLDFVIGENREKNNITEACEYAHKNLMFLAIPFLVLSWLLYVYVLIVNLLVLTALPFFLIFQAKMIQITYFVADRMVCAQMGYRAMQGYFHENFEKDSTWLRFRSGILRCFGWHPFFRCRSANLKKYFHSVRGKEVQ